MRSETPKNQTLQINYVDSTTNDESITIRQRLLALRFEEPTKESS